MGNLNVIAIVMVIALTVFTVGLAIFVSPLHPYDRRLLPRGTQGRYDRQRVGYLR
jgi:hypothetical protein